MATAAEHQAQIDRINGEVATQAAKIAQLSTILDGKAGGGGGGSGGSVETCTVTFKNNDTFDYYVFCPTITGGRLEHMNYTGEYVVTDVPCKTVATLFGSLGEWSNDPPAGVTINYTVAQKCSFYAWAIEIDVAAGTNVLLGFE